jgi:hypothetical protein
VQHPDKTFAGKLARGFSFLGYEFNASGLIGIARPTRAEFGPRRLLRLGGVFFVGPRYRPDQRSRVRSDSGALENGWRNGAAQGKSTDLGGDGNFHYNVMEVDRLVGRTPGDRRG